MYREFKRPFVNALFSIWIYALHALQAVAVIGLIWCVEQAIHTMWPHETPRLFGRVPLDYVIHTMDGGVLVVFIVLGTWETFRYLR